MFKITNNRCDTSLILLPGWATDHRIFEKLDLPYDYILPAPFNPNTFEAEFLEYAVQNNIKKVSLFGWSLGGYCAADFAVKHPEMIEELILVSIKKKYEKDGIEKVKGYLKESRKAYLYKFYLECFAGGKEQASKWFKDKLMKEYLEMFSLEELYAGLDYLVANPLDTEALKNTKASFIYGLNDRIVPAKEVIELKKKLPGASFELVEGAGHIPFP
ncbi:MAG: alpha/beta hydrolase [Candidatus Margulisiibacteriota bacterium]